MPGVGEHETIDELGMPVRQPLRVAATGGDAHDPDRAPPLLANDRGVVVGDVNRRAAGRRSARRPTSTNVRSCRLIGSSQRFHDRRIEAALDTSAVNDSPGIDSTTREPEPTRAYGCPEGSLPVSIIASFDGMRGRYAIGPALRRDVLLLRALRLLLLGLRWLRRGFRDLAEHLGHPGAQQRPPLGLHIAIATSSSGGLTGGQVLVGHGVRG